MVKLFQKLARRRARSPPRRPQTAKSLKRRFLFDSFFFCALCVKRKSGKHVLCRYAAIISSTVGRWLVCRRCRNAIFAAQCGYNSITTSDDRWSPLQPNIDHSCKSHKICSFIMVAKDVDPYNQIEILAVNYIKTRNT